MNENFFETLFKLVEEGVQFKEIYILGQNLKQSFGRRIHLKAFLFFFF